MNNFVYYTPTKVFFGKDEEKKIGKILKDYEPHKVMIVYGGGSIKKIGLYDLVINSLKEEGINFVELYGVKANPDIELVYQGIKLGIKEEVDFILAIGGGSVLDTAKDIAHGIAEPGVDVWDFHRYIKKPVRTLRKGAILTISAAGSEMSNSCVISNLKTKEKKGFASDFNRFDFAIENPELTYSVSPYQTSCGIVDIAMHTIERFFSPGECYLTDEIALSVIKSTFKFGKKARKSPMDYESRAELMWASSLAHNGLTHAGREMIMAVHQLEHELSALDPNIAHGAGLAALWCSWARYVYKYARERFIKYVNEIWDIEGNDDKAILEGIKKQEEYYQSIGMPTSLEELGIKEPDLLYLAERCSLNKTKTISGYKSLSYEDMLEIYRLALHKR
ncbi:MAG: iron-containing alcohol dehydrogenase [Bacilli bacterium]|nr:iron-containing alcohol dehydrogenase [Bacilli bacterium]